jgi:hypothetical protein
MSFLAPLKCFDWKSVNLAASFTGIMARYRGQAASQTNLPMIVPFQTRVQSIGLGGLC